MITIVIVNIKFAILHVDQKEEKNRLTSYKYEKSNNSNNCKFKTKLVLNLRYYI